MTTLSCTTIPKLHKICCRSNIVKFAKKQKTPDPDTSYLDDIAIPVSGDAGAFDQRLVEVAELVTATFRQFFWVFRRVIVFSQPRRTCLGW